MPRRVNLPGANELFRGDGAAAAARGKQSGTSAGRATQAHTTTGRAPKTQSTRPQTANAGPTDGAAAAEASGPTGRVRHDEKITVYVSSEELLGLERARLDLRASHGIAVDRGRIVREAIDMVLADLEERGADAELVRRLSQP